MGEGGREKKIMDRQGKLLNVLDSQIYNSVYFLSVFVLCLSLSPKISREMKAEALKTKKQMIG